MELVDAGAPVELVDAGAPVVLDATMPPIAEGWAILELVFLAAAAKASRVFGPDDLNSD